MDVIVGNPPFLGGNKIRKELGDQYVEALFKLYEGRVPAFADLVCYWFEKARAQIASGKAKRVGLLATQAIRGGANREVLERIKETGDIFWAQSDRDWILDGAAVNVSMVGFDDGSERGRELDGLPTIQINPDLTPEVDVTVARKLVENRGICFMGPSPKAPFDMGVFKVGWRVGAGFSCFTHPSFGGSCAIKSGFPITWRNPPLQLILNTPI